MWYNEFAEGSLTISDIIPLFTAILSRYANLNGGILYKDNMGIISGIYEIRNKLNRHKYIGSSVDIESRWEDHKRMLRGGCHYNIYLQRAWNKYGEENFEFKIVAYTDPDKAIVLEDFILQNYFDRFEYNIAKSAVAPFLGREHTEEEKRKMSKAHSGENGYWFGKRRSEKTKQKMSKAHSGENNPFYGRNHSEETKRKISEANSGKHRSEETKRKMSKSLSGKKNPRWINMTDEEIMMMKSLSEQGYSYRKIADIFGISHGAVWNRLNAKQ